MPSMPVIAICIVPLSLITIISLYLAIFAWKQKPRHNFFILFMISTAIWASGYAMEILNSSLNMKIFWGKIEYIGIVFIPVSWFGAVLQYTGNEKWLKKRNIAYLFIVPITTLILAWTNKWHHLIWKEVGLAYFDSSSALKIIHGSYFWIHAFYSYALVLISIIFLIFALFTFPAIYKGKTITLLIGVLIPWIVNMLYVFDINPFYPIDLTPFTTFLSGLAMAFAVLRLKALDIIPIAREKIIEIMKDAVIVIDNNQIIDANKSAKELFGLNIIGKSAKKIFGNKLDILESDRVEEIELNGRYYAVNISPIYARRHKVGNLAIFYDITDRKKAEDRIKQLNEELRLINKIMRHDILNDLQVIQGLLETEYKGDKEIFEKLMKRIKKSIRLMKRAKDIEYLASIEKMKEYDMRGVIENVAKEYDVKVNIHGNCKVKADDAIYSVIDNIIMNAIIHGKANQIDVTLHDNGGECIIKIADNGKGIPDEIKDKIFEERFSYGETKGSGLGLYIVKKIVEKYGGSIEVKDNVPRGAVFIIRLRK